MSSPRRGQGVTLLLVSTLTVMAGAIIAPALPGIHAAFADLAQVDLLTRLVLTSPALAIALGAPLAGWLIDRLGRLGRHRVLLPAMVLYTLGGTAGLYVAGMTELLISRVILGFAVAGILPAVTTLVADLYVGEARGRFMGLQSAFMALGGTVFLVAGGALADQSWRAPFAVYGAALVLFPAVILCVPRPTLDVVRSEHRAEAESTPRGVVAGLYSAVLAGMVMFYLVPVQLPFLMETRFGASGVEVGLALALCTTYAAVASLSTARLAGRVGRHVVLVLTFVLPAVALAWLSAATTWAHLIGALALGGFGAGFIMPNCMTWMADVAPLASRGRVLAGGSAALFLGQFVSPIAAAPFLGEGGEVGSAFTAGAVFSGAIAVVCLVLAFAPRTAR